MSVNYNSYQKNSYPTRRVREQLEKFHNSLPVPGSFKFNLNSSALSLDSVDWNDLQGIEFSENSTNPQFLCQFSSNQALVVKGISSVVEEIFAVNLMSALNIHTLKYRVVQFTQREFNEMTNALQRVSIGDKYVENAIMRELDKPFIIIQEYIVSMYFLQMGKNRAENVFSLDTQLGYRRLREIGEIIAVDVLLNNQNRVPVLWDTPGNTSAILVKLEEPDLPEEDFLNPGVPVRFSNIYAVDSFIGQFEGENKELLQEEYLEKVEKYVRGTIRDLDNALQGRTFGLLNLETVEIVKECFSRSVRVEIGNKELFQVLKGILGTFKEIAEMDIEEFEDIFREIARVPEEDWKGVWEAGLAKVNLGFILTIKEKIERIVNENKQSFDWVYMMYKVDDAPLYF